MKFICGKFFFVSVLKMDWIFAPLYIVVWKID